jgi:hypothetical protein
VWLRSLEDSVGAVKGQTSIDHRSTRTVDLHTRVMMDRGMHGPCVRMHAADLMIVALFAVHELNEFDVN